MISKVELIISCVIWPYGCLWRNVYLDLLPVFSMCVCVCFFNWVSCLCCLYILETKFLLVPSFVNTFSHSVACLSVMLMLPLLVKVYNVDKAPLVYFCFHLFCLGRLIYESIVTVSVRACFAHVFLHKFYDVMSLVFKSFWVSFVYSGMECSNIIDLLVAVLFSKHYFLKVLSFLHCIYSHFSTKINWLLVYGFISGLFCCIDLKDCFLTKITLFLKTMQFIVVYLC